MATTDVISINRSVKIIQHTGKLQLTKTFAENNLSKSALKYAEKTDTHYSYNWGKDAFIVVFELPKLFNVNFGELLRYFVNYCSGYIKDNNISDAVVYTRFMENCNKTIKM